MGLFLYHKKLEYPDEFFFSLNYSVPRQPVSYNSCFFFFLNETHPRVRFNFLLAAKLLNGTPVNIDKHKLIEINPAGSALVKASLGRYLPTANGSSFNTNNIKYWSYLGFMFG